MEAGTTGYLVFAIGAGIVFYSWQKSKRTIDKHVEKAGGTNRVLAKKANDLQKYKNNYAAFMSNWGDSSGTISTPHGITSVKFS
jgi:hypothetical protein